MIYNFTVRLKWYKSDIFIVINLRLMSFYFLTLYQLLLLLLNILIQIHNTDTLPFINLYIYLKLFIFTKLNCVFFFIFIFYIQCINQMVKNIILLKLKYMQCCYLDKYIFPKNKKKLKKMFCKFVQYIQIIKLRFHFQISIFHFNV